MSYTIKNLREVADAAERFGFSETQESRFAREDLGAETIGLALHFLRPGKRQPFAHRHQQAEEVYVVLSGSGRIKLEDEIADIRPLDAIRVAAPVTRSLEAGPDGLEVLVFGPRHGREVEFVPEGFWD